MMKKWYSLLMLVFCSGLLSAQPGKYSDEMKNYRETYVIKHEVVQGKDKNFFRFYPLNEVYKVKAGFEKIIDTIGFVMKTSGTKNKRFFRYGILRFTINGLP